MLRNRTTLLAMLQVVALCGVIWSADGKDGFVDTFKVNKSDLASVGRNDYFVLEPGYQLALEGKEGDKALSLIITVLDETRMVDGVETRIVEERESENGNLVEVSRNFFAIDKATNDVYYFGEEVDEYRNGQIIGHPGSWQSGKDGARFGLFMPAKPVVGQRFYQEVAPRVAMDRCQIMSTTERLKVPAGSYADCLRTRETTPLEPDMTEQKVYASGVGLIADADLKLASCRTQAKAGA